MISIRRSVMALLARGVQGAYRVNISQTEAGPIRALRFRIDCACARPWGSEVPVRTICSERKRRAYTEFDIVVARPSRLRWLHGVRSLSVQTHRCLPGSTSPHRASQPSVSSRESHSRRHHLLRLPRRNEPGYLISSNLHPRNRHGGVRSDKATARARASSRQPLPRWWISSRASPAGRRMRATTRSATR